MSKIDSFLKFQVYDLGIHRDEAVSGIVIAHEKKDDDGVKKSYKDYQLYDRMIQIGESMIDGGLENWDWKWVANEGHLCDMDWKEEWFKDNLEKAGVSKEEYDKKWK